MMAMSLEIFIYFNSPQFAELYGTRGGSGAALCQEATADAMGRVVAP
jgi:hypothetical protein